VINWSIRPIACAALVIVAGSCSDSPSTPVAPTPPPTPLAQSVTVLAVGDIGQCGSPGVAQTARLVEGLAGLAREGRGSFLQRGVHGLLVGDDVCGVARRLNAGGWNVRARRYARICVAMSLPGRRCRL